MTNAEKFKEVFGIYPSIIPAAPKCMGLDCPKELEETDDCDKCKYLTFWEDDYKEQGE